MVIITRNMLYLVLFAYSLFFFLLAFKNFRLAVGLFIVGLPAYLVRFKLGPLPSTLLELNFGILFLVWLIKFARKDLLGIKAYGVRNKFFFALFSLFFAASLISIFTSDMWYYSLGQWRAYFLEPMLLFVMLLGRSNSTSPNNITPDSTIWFLSLSTLSVSVFGILQRFTHWHIGNVDWIALQTGRVTSFFLSPNAVGLYLAPIVPLTCYLLVKNYKAVSHLKRYTLYLILFSSLITVILTKSVGAFLGLAAGVLVWLWLVGYKKITLVALIAGVVLSALLYPTLINSKSQSGANRLTLWSYSWNYLSASPKNFVLGTGIRQFFRKIQKPYYDVKKMERLIYPHNIFLNFWTETGLFGLIGFIGIYYFLLAGAYSIYKNNSLLGASLISALAIFLVHGLIDVPYLKNDLAMLFWLLSITILIAQSSFARQSSR